MGMGAKEDELSTGHFCGWISPCYSPILLGTHFETYEPFISLVFHFFEAMVNRRY
jgi:hypothetical protein